MVNNGVLIVSISSLITIKFMNKLTSLNFHSTSLLLVINQHGRILTIHSEKINSFKLLQFLHLDFSTERNLSIKLVALKWFNNKIVLWFMNQSMKNDLQIILLKSIFLIFFLINFNLLLFKMYDLLNFKKSIP